ncbi:hypothetical protein IQ287_27730 [Burkholderia sp. R-69927]|nr:hypothetical protein [Burkholderia sp. R-70006]MBK5065331.1 hypothetical protein [Burkholderia sp. R-70199]MBK5089763.1 hypothetical protein [Burkholderia sp. R-69927]MBK5124461.1 hypothetical protein [Burkholderia sp. R-69980]MBK5168781.1 hypothetical protein [Burkholderia sp. R-70211]MBK5184091.1 hypothetical protein [Burkholderia sp. R-69749]MCI0147696.1 hypothetical protein [Paraburkholderia sediminicola]
MRCKKKYLGISALIITSLLAFFLGCLFAKKHDAGKTAVGDAKVSEATISDAKTNDNDPAVWMNPYAASSPIYREFNEYRQWILNNKQLTAASGTALPTDLLMLSGQLAAKGMPRLPADVLEQRLSSLNKILPSLDTHMCSTLIKGGFNASEFTSQAASVMNSFNADEAKAWFSVGRAAIEAQLDGSPLIVLPTEDALRGILKISKSMHEPQSKDFISGMAHLKTANEEDACATVRILYSRGNSLPDPYRGYMARMLLTGTKGNEKL